MRGRAIRGALTWGALTPAAPKSTGRYAALQRNEYEHSGGYAIVPVRHSDMLLIQKWRNAQMAVLRQKRKLSNADQHRYYTTVMRPEMRRKRPTLVLFSFLLNKDAIGYGGLTHIDWEARRTELAFILDPARTGADSYAREFAVFLTLIKRVVFEDLKLNRLFTETYDIRPVHLATLEANGFRLEGRLRQHVCVDGRLVDSLVHGITAADRDI